MNKEIDNESQYPEIFNTDKLIKNLKDSPENIVNKLPLDHIFSEGLYTRVLTVPAGVFVVGKVHKHKTLNILLKGEVLLYLGDNEQPKRVKAPQIFESDAGVRKAVLAIKETMFANVHVTSETDLDKIESEFIEPDESSIGNDQKEFISSKFKEVLSELG